MATKNISVSQIRDDINPSTVQQNIPRKNSDITNFARTILGQGTLLGFGDELEAGVRNIFDKRGYGEILDEVQGELKQFKKDRPVASVVSEIAGSLPSGALGIGKTLVKTAVKSGGLGAIYGAGATDTSDTETLGEEATKRIQNAVNSAVFSAGVGAGAQKLFKTSKEAKKLLDKGVELSPAQTIDGALGSGLKKIEEALTSIPVVGTSSMMKNVKRTYNIAVANEIGKPIGVVIPKNTPLKDVSKILTQKIKTAIDDSAENLILKSPDELLDNIIVGIKNSKADPKIINREIKKFNDVFMRDIKITPEGFIKGSSIQKLDEYLRALGKDFADADNYDLRLISDVFNKGADDLANALKKDSGESIYNTYKATKNAYKNLVIFNRASISSAKEGFEPSQLIKSNIINDPTKGKVGTILGKGELQDIAQTGQSVIGKTVPDSGTALRVGVGSGLLGGGYLTGVNPVAGGIGAMGLLAYKSPFIRNALIGGKGITKASPYLGSTLGERIGLKWQLVIIQQHHQIILLLIVLVSQKECHLLTSTMLLEMNYLI